MSGFMSHPAGAAVRQRLQDVGGVGGKEVVGMFFDWLLAGVPMDEALAARASGDRLTAATTVEAARARVLAEFGVELRSLEQRLPASRLSGR
jgi:hypothetical protein